MLKRGAVLLLILVVIGGLVIYWTKIKPLEMKLFTFGTEKIISEGEKSFPSERAEKFYISSGEGYPVFTKEVIVDPFKVKEGEKQIFSIWAKDPQGIERVRATIQTDVKEEVIELKLVEGDEIEGRWLGFWTTKDISIQTSYLTVFQAINKNKEETKLPLAWQIEK